MDIMELIKQKRAALQSGRRQKTIKVEDGRSRYRILPGWRGAGDPTFYHDFGQHFIKGNDGTIQNGGAVYICSDKTFGRPCGVCQALELAIKATTDDAMVERLANAKASGRILVNALHIDGETPNDPQILELAPTVFDAILGIAQEWGTETVITEGEGRDVIIERTGKAKNTKYTVQVAGKPTTPPDGKGIMKKVANLDEYVQQESEEMAKRALTSIASVAGLLPAPAASRPSAPSKGIASVDDAEVVESTAVATSSKAAAAPAPGSAASNEDLDELLAGLDK